MKTLITVLFMFYSFCVFSQAFTTQSEWEAYFISATDKLDPIEGIWKITSTMKIYNDNNQLIYTKNDTQIRTKVVYKLNNKFISHTIVGNDSYVVMFSNTATSNHYLVNIYNKNAFSTAKTTATMTDSGLLEFSYEKPDDLMKYGSGGHHIIGTIITFEHQWVKIYPNLQKKHP
ncbi:MAG: hypothetical protein PHW82_08660 [Bacteroidales bacterium]|nr:hypothetical protein [Bacteroidales bacterium]MDD4216663.1 hypothetical protein [Bacteroidales bacterium]MDY0141523.1 hypothetical protein [Bacteroidales bacterium]